jgi:hypothetical protein
MATNHGGNAVIIVFGVHLGQLNIGVDPQSFEMLCVL